MMTVTSTPSHLISVVEQTDLYGDEVVGGYFMQLRNACVLPGRLDPFYYYRQGLTVKSTRRDNLVLRVSINGDVEGSYVRVNDLAKIGRIVRQHVLSIDA